MKCIPSLTLFQRVSRHYWWCWGLCGCFCWWWRFCCWCWCWWCWCRRSSSQGSSQWTWRHQSGCSPAWWSRRQTGTMSYYSRDPRLLYSCCSSVHKWSKSTHYLEKKRREKYKCMCCDLKIRNRCWRVDTVWFRPTGHELWSLEDWELRDWTCASSLSHMVYRWFSPAADCSSNLFYMKTGVVCEPLTMKKRSYEDI